MTFGEAPALDREILGWHEFGEASRELATQVRASGFLPDMVVAIARGGLLLAGSVAYATASWCGVWYATVLPSAA